MARETLTPDQIVKAAIDLLDTEGLEGLNMRSLGARLDSAATAVYWHVGSKENLIALASDLAWSEIALPDLTAIDWRTAATQMATDLHTMLIRHTWLLQAFGSFVSYGPGRARYIDHSLAIYEAAGFAGPRVDQACATVFTFVLGNTLGAAAGGSLHRKFSGDGGNAEKRIHDGMAKAREIAAQFPRLRTRLSTAAADYSSGPEQSFEFGLQVILEGLTSERFRPAGRPSKPPPPRRKAGKPARQKR
ncbi:MAG: TetR/AcrR family transcriptional regulator [Myxococcota bacterium]|nr:TetR/AcrR family transcriptional regulator [Myxococcota bacterium]